MATTEYYPWSPLPKDQLLFLKELSDLTAIAKKTQPGKKEGELTIDIVSDDNGVTKHQVINNNQPIGSGLPSKQPISGVAADPQNSNKEKNSVRGQHGVPNAKTVNINKKHLVYSTDYHSVCQFSPVSYNVSLRRGRDSGVFTDHGEVLGGTAQCSQICCQRAHCDVAFMLDKNCFTVKCHSALDCMPTKKPLPFSTSVVYTLYRRKTSSLNVAYSNNTKGGETTTTKNATSGVGHLDVQTSKGLGAMFDDLKKSIHHKDSQLELKGNQKQGLSPKTKDASSSKKKHASNNQNGKTEGVGGDHAEVPSPNDSFLVDPTTPSRTTTTRATSISPPESMNKANKEDTIEGSGEDSGGEMVIDVVKDTQDFPEDDNSSKTSNTKDNKGKTTPSPKAPDQLDGEDFPQAMDDSPKTTTTTTTKDSPNSAVVKHQTNTKSKAEHQGKIKHSNKQNDKEDQFGEKIKDKDFVTRKHKVKNEEEEFDGVDRSSDKKPIDNVITFEDNDVSLPSNDVTGEYGSRNNGDGGDEELEDVNKRLKEIELERDLEKEKMRMKNVFGEDGSNFRQDVGPLPRPYEQPGEWEDDVSPGLFGNIGRSPVFDGDLSSTHHRQNEERDEHQRQKVRRI